MDTSNINLNTPKRKRGRPPKANNFSNKITKTINISINTPPKSNSPNAENNSNQTVKRGIPDIFTPTMRVSPTSHHHYGGVSHSRNGSLGTVKQKKRSKKNSISSIDSISPVKRKGSFTSNQGSPVNDYINSKTLDNISMITNNSNPMQNPYQSPPPTVKQAAKKTKNLLPPVSIIPEFEKSISPTAAASSHSNNLDSAQSHESVSMSHDVTSAGGSSPVGGSNLNSSSTSVAVEPQMAGYDFSLKLMIDDLGKAVLSNHDRQQTPNRHSQSYPAHAQSQPHPHHNQIRDDLTPTRPRHHSQTDFQDYDKPKLYHSNSAIGIESKYLESQSHASSISDYDYSLVPNHSQAEPPQSQSQPQESQAQVQSQASSNQAQRPVPVKYHSDFNYSEENPPQTPKPKENYMLSTGLTPYYNNTSNGINLSTNTSNNPPFLNNPNLTPQFNSLMNSIVNSPKKFNNNQFMFNQDMFMSNNFNSMGYNNNNGNGNGVNGGVNGSGSEFYPQPSSTPVPHVPLNQSQQLQQGQFQQQYAGSSGLGGGVNVGGQFNQNGSIPLQLQPQFSNQLQHQQYQSFQFNDDSDARSALKKMIHVKRK